MIKLNQPTMQLRWLVLSAQQGAYQLQQMWLIDGKEEWRAIPYVSLPKESK